MVVAQTHWVTVGIVMKFTAIATSAALGAVIFATNAMATIYDCDVRRNGQFGWISPKLVFAISKDETEASVYDVLIKEFHGEPIEAKIVVANPKRYTLKWSIYPVSGFRGQNLPRIDYRATYLKASHRFTVTGFPAGYDNQLNGTGTCKRTK